ncbi:hypothetical protein [Photobacterium profundum]|uniref:hypothetical protein n=1 Tax=Photobacterium profundum TaxID=74109 RepID=UPI003D0CF8B2
MSGEPSDKALLLFGNMIELYGPDWYRVHGSEPSERFCVFADSLEHEQLVRVIGHCQERLSNNIGFAPALGLLNSWRDVPSNTELQLARDRVMGKQHINEIERWILSRMRFNFSRMAPRDVEREFRLAYLQAIQLKKHGGLFVEENEILRLPINTTVMPTDKARQEFNGELPLRLENWLKKLRVLAEKRNVSRKE